MIDLAAKPFYLKPEDIEWVNTTLAGMTTEEKAGQLFCVLFKECKPEEFEYVFNILKPGGCMYRVVPTERAIASARQAGYDLTALRARQVNATDFARFDWIIVADRQNLAELQRRCPADQQHKLQLMCAWLEGQDVPDPYYGGPEGFVDMIRLLEQAMAAMLAQLCPSNQAAQRGTPGGTDAH